MRLTEEDFIKPEFFKSNDLKKELEIENNLKLKVFLRDGLKCTNCGYETTRDFLEVHFKDYNLENTTMDNLTTVCKYCHNIAHLDTDFEERDKESLGYILVKNRMDHLKQSEIVFFLRIMYVLKLKELENNGKEIKFKTLNLIKKELLSESVQEMMEIFEEIESEINGELENEEDIDFNMWEKITPKNLYELINNYFKSDQNNSCVNDLKDRFVLIPLFEKELQNDLKQQITVLNSTINKEIESQVMDFIDSNSEIFEFKELVKILNK